MNIGRWPIKKNRIRELKLKRYLRTLENKQVILQERIKVVKQEIKDQKKENDK